MVTNEQGGVVSEQNYYPYGETRAKEQESQSTTERQYTSQISDTGQTGLYYYNARYYSPVIGQFVQADSKFGPNRYSYTGGNPINIKDPSGYEGESATEWLTKRLGSKKSAEAALNLANNLVSYLRDEQINYNLTIDPISEKGEELIKIINNMPIKSNTNKYDLMAFNRTHYGKDIPNIALMTAISGQESSFTTQSHTVSGKPFPYNAHAGEFLVQGLLYQQALDDYYESDYRMGTDDYGDILFYYPGSTPLYGDMINVDSITRLGMHWNESYMHDWPREQYGGVTSLLYAIRMRTGYSGLNGEIDLYDEKGGLNINLLRSYYHAGAANNNTKIWANNTNNYYKIFQELADLYPNEYGFLLEDIRKIYQKPETSGQTHQAF